MNNQSAPSFAIGDLVSLRSNAAIVMPILTVSESASGEHRYTVFQNNIKITYYESQLQAFAEPFNNYSTLSVSEFHAYLTSQYILSPSNSHLFSLHSGRVKFIPYQYRPVLKLIRADRPRLLIADEVGVGKTIEAGLIIKELRARMDLNSILIICPNP
jgi:ATP-dependent helicase HepA